MAAYWRLGAEPRGVVITVEATIEGAGETGWYGQLTTVPFGKITAEGNSHSSVREQLAKGVLAEIGAGAVPVPTSMVDAVRVMSTSAARYLRGGDDPSGPVISVPAIADSDGSRWCAATVSAAGHLSRQAAFGETISAACDALADGVMLALEVGVDGLRHDWSGIRLLILTRKTYPAGILPAV
jgi:hypothetical protein